MNYVFKIFSQCEKLVYLRLKVVKNFVLAPKAKGNK
jgi:hypothetical protein